MAKISLRAYIKEIERLIDNKRLDEALAHCHHILEAFPKHIDTYRLFGKAYLEQQRFGDAADIFQRVLSTLPDDFVSHVGMSIIREDEGNLDEALFHIQQASEIQPSNTAVQDELRQLYGRRDGIEPPKIRLTRGALARMYIKGELFQQAGVEIRAALAEDASRIDLQILLALVYFKTGKSSEAIEIARNVLKKLPNAYQANYILAAILSKSDRSQDAAQYQQIVNQLNPYAAHVSEKYPTPDQVPDQAVILEKMDWKAEQDTSLKPGQPAWADSLGLKLDESKQQQEEEVPDWMKSAGWELSDADSEPVQEDQSSPATDVEEQQDSEIEKAELPAWLKDLAPSEEQITEESDEEAEDDEDVLPWIEKIIPPNKTEFAEEPEEGLAEQKDADTPASGQFIPPWLAEFGDETEQEEEAAEIPDWLAAPEEEVGDVDDIALAEEPEAELTDEIPDWLRTPEEEISDVDNIITEVETETEVAAEIPDWLAAPEEEVGDAEDIASAVESEAELAAEIPDWLTAPEEEVADAEEILTEIETEAELAAEIPDWLAASEEEVGDAEDIFTEVETEAELAAEIPDWLTAPEEEVGDAEDIAAGLESEAVLAVDIPDWLRTPEEEIGDLEDIAATVEAEAELAVDIPDWLSATEVEVGDAEDIAAEVETEAELAVDIPDWLRATQEETGDTEDIAAAVKSEAELASEIPDWLAAPSDDAKTTWDGSSVEQPEAEFTGEIPDWLAAPEEEVGDAEDIASAVESEAELDVDIPDWLSQLDVPEASLEDTRPSKTTLVMAEKKISAEELEEASEQSETLAQTTSETEFETSISEVDAELTVEQPGDQLETEEQDEAFAWLEGLAVKQGADQETLFSDEKQRETTPEWLPEAEQDLAEVEAKQSEPEDVVISNGQDVQEELEWVAEEFDEPEMPIEGDPAMEPPSDFVEASQVEEAISELEEMDDAFAWLESLAAKQGVEEAMLLKPEERQSEAPEWVRLESLDEPAEPETPEEVAPVSEGTTEQASTSAELETDIEPPIQEIESQETVIAWSQPEPEPAILLSDTEEISLSEQESGPVEIEKPLEAEVTEEPLEAEAVAAEILGEEEVTEDLYEPEAVISEEPDETELTEEPSLPEAVEIETPDEAEVRDEPLKAETIVFETLDEEEVTEVPFEPEAVELGAPEEAQPKDESLENEEMPELPAWLADAEATPEDEVLEWTPPSRTLKPVELNQASLVELERLPGVGFRLAQEIIAYRDQHGPFDSLEQLAEVPGADELNLEALKPFLVLPEPVEPAVEAAVSTHAHTFTQAAELPELQPARQAMQQGDLESGLQVYNKLVEDQQALPDVIQDLEEAVKYHPDSFKLWQTLGDAYQRSDQIREALAAYLKAQELLG